MSTDLFSFAASKTNNTKANMTKSRTLGGIPSGLAALHRMLRRSDRAAATRQIQHQGGTVHDRVALQGAAATPDTQSPGSRPPALGESTEGLTAKDYFAE